MHPKRKLIITILTSLLLAAVLLSTTDYQLLIEKTERHAEIMIQVPENESPIEISDFSYHGISLPLTMITVSEGWEREEERIYTTGDTEALAYLSFWGYDDCSLTFSSEDGNGTVSVYVDGNLTEEIRLSEQTAESYTWNYRISPESTDYQRLLFIFSLFFILLLCLLTLIQLQYAQWAKMGEEAPADKKNYRSMWAMNLLISVLYIGAALSRRLDDTRLYNKLDYLSVSYFFLLLTFILNHLLRTCGQKLLGHLSEYARKIYSLCALFLFPILSLFYLEWMLGSAGLFTDWRIFFCNIIWFYLVFGFFYCLRLNVRSGIRWGTGIVFGIGIANFFVLAFRNRPILPNDLYVLSLAADVAQNYTFQISDKIYIASLLLGAFWSLTLLLPGEKAPFFRKAFLKRMAGWLCYFFILTVTFFRLDLAGFMHMPMNWWDASENYSEYGFVASFLSYAQDMVLERPEGYSRQRVQELLQNMEIPSSDKDNSPNIIVIMNEAWADFTGLSSVETSEDYLPFYHSLSENTIKGNMYVSIWGGNTSTTEYEFLTGNSPAFFTFGAVPYQQYVTHPTENFTTILKEKGYYTTALHPYEGSGYSRNHVYPFFGFDEIHFIEDYKNPGIVRWCIDDRSSFEKIIESYEEHKGSGPQFIFNVTMQNHGSYGKYVKEGNFQPTIDIYSGNAGDIDIADIQEYLSLIRLTDEALEELLNYFSEEDEDTVIVMFGDHQPGLSSASTKLMVPLADSSLKEQVKRYQVPFLIWANFDIGEQQGVQISANYLSTYLLNLLHMELSPFEQFLLNQRQTIPVMNVLGYMSTEGIWYTYGSGPEALEQQLNEYQCLQYYRIADSN